jgi:hypothetical protein
MRQASSVICVQCGQPIGTLHDLVIRGLNFGFHPLHTNCYELVKSRWIYRISLNVRGSGFWVFLIAMNSILASCIIARPDSWHDLRWFFLIVNVPQLIFRFLAYVSYELPLQEN